MGLGDFLKGAASALTPDPLEQSIAWAGREIGEALNKQFQGHMRAERAPTGGATSLDRSPVTHHTVAAVEGPAAAPYRELGQYLEGQAQNKVDAATGYYNLAKMTVTHPRETGRAFKELGAEVWNNPGVLKSVGTEIAVQTALDPFTYMGGPGIIGAHIAERTAARAGERAASEAAQQVTERVAREAAEEAGERVAARTATEVAEEVGGTAGRRTASAAAQEASRAAREAAPEGIEGAWRAQGRRTTRSGRFLEGLQERPVNMREWLTDNPVGPIGQSRIDLGERLLPGAQPTLRRTVAKDIIQGSPFKPTEGRALGYRQAVWNARQTARRAMGPAHYQTARNVERVGIFLNDPERALHDPQVRSLATRGMEWAIEEHPEAVAAIGGMAAVSAAAAAAPTIAAVAGLGSKAAAEQGGEEGGEAKTPYTPHAVERYSPQDIGLMQFQADRTHATRSRRRPGQAAQLGMVSGDTMPRQIGPSNWYGPQGGYDAGRGFRQRTAQPVGPLTPLKQPRRQRDVLGV